mgnify:CR=1 FL=1
MKTKYYFLTALATTMFASCANDEFVGDNSPTAQEQVGDGSIQFGFDFQNTTRADIVGNEAATKLGSNFYVMGTKGSAETATPSLTKVFDNYLVRYTENTSGKTQSNTSNWEYVGVTADANHVKLSPAAVENQTIKFWDYSQEQYDFLAFSTGTWKALKTTSPNAANSEIGVTSIASGTALGTEAYSFYLPSINALEQTYITDIVNVQKANFSKEVTLRFKNLGSKVRLALYETVPGYSIKASSVKFYTVNGTTDFTDANKSKDAKLISSDANTFAGAGTVQVKFLNMGTNNLNNSNYNKATATVTGISGGDTKKSFGSLDDNTKAIAEGTETAGKIYIGRSLPAATFAGSKSADYYKTVFPISNSYPLTLRVDYTLISTDGSGEEINIYGAKAVIPSNYTVWQPNYAYTYIFKISDNTNGWTDIDHTKAGLFPITFDVVVAEATDASGEQTTVSTVSTPSIITYQQGHTYKTNEYSKSTKGADNVVRKLYVMVMHNEGNPEAHPAGSTYAECPMNILSTTNALLYKVSDGDATEAEVMDALENRTTDIATDNVTGRNNITLTKNSHISAVSTIVNGPDDNPITIASDHGNAAEIDIANEGVPAGTYAFVYDYTNGSKTTTTFYQPKSVGTTSIPNGTRYITKAILDGISTTTSADETVNSNGFLYFSKTTDGTGTTTYSYYSVDGKTTLPAGLLKVAINDSNLPTSDGSAATSSAAFIFDVYTRNNGSYAVKVIKIVA